MKEFRCIVFNDHEVATAFVERRRRLREALPVGTVRGVHYQKAVGDGVTTTIEITDDYGAIETISVRPAEIAAALVDLCLNRHIPIPAGSKKWIEVISDGELTLLMSVGGVGKRRMSPPRRLEAPL